MRELVLTPKFRRAFRKFVKRNRKLQEAIEQTLEQMQQEVFDPRLGTHKLSGELYGLWACSCGYDCRIVFALEQAEQSGDEVVVLLDIGTHDEVY
jgi:addiction module RelE/StbE family toxin